MKEKLFEIGAINPVEIFGANDSKLALIRKRFPKLKLVARGTSLKAIGDDAQLNLLEAKLEALIFHYNKYHSLSEKASV